MSELRNKMRVEMELRGVQSKNNKKLYHYRKHIFKIS